MDSPRWEGIEAVRVDVRNLLVAQEAFHHFYGAYATSLEALVARTPMSFHSEHVETLGAQSGCVITVWDDSLKPGPSRCTVYMGEMAKAAGVRSGLLKTE